MRRGGTGAALPAGGRAGPLPAWKIMAVCLSTSQHENGLPGTQENRSGGFEILMRKNDSSITGRC
jgi:hypothetical protein